MTMEGSVTTNIIVIYTVAMREGNKCERETLLDLKVETSTLRVHERNCGGVVELLLR